MFRKHWPESSPFELLKHSPSKVRVENYFARKLCDQPCGDIAQVLVDRTPQPPPEAGGSLHHQMVDTETMSTAAVVRFSVRVLLNDLSPASHDLLSFFLHRVPPIFRRSRQCTQLLLTNPNPAAVSRFRLGLVPAEGEFQQSGSSGRVLRTCTMGTHPSSVFLCSPTAACVFCKCGAAPKPTLSHDRHVLWIVQYNTSNPRQAILMFFVFKLWHLSTRQNIALSIITCSRGAF